MSKFQRNSFTQSKVTANQIIFRVFLLLLLFSFFQYFREIYRTDLAEIWTIDALEVGPDILFFVLRYLFLLVGNVEFSGIFKVPMCVSNQRLTILLILECI